MKNYFDITCDDCLESGSPARMDIKDGTCYYCRVDPGKMTPLPDDEITKLRSINNDLVEALLAIKRRAEGHRLGILGVHSGDYHLLEIDMAAAAAINKAKS